MAGGNLNLDGFITPTDNFAGLYNLSDTLQNKNALDSANADRAQRESDRLKAQQNAQSEFFTNELNKKNNLTGSLYDNNISSLLGNALQQAQKLSSQGAQTSDIQMAIQPLLDQVNTYQSKAKMYDANKKAFIESMKGVNGYDLNKITQLADQKAFYDIDPKTKQPVLNVDKVDPSHNYYADVVAENPNLVTNSSSIPTLIKSITPDVNKWTINRTNSYGGSEKRSSSVTAPYYIKPDKNGDLAPVYEYAKDGDKLHLDDNGQPVKVLPRKIFYDLLNTKEGMGVADWLKGQLKQAGDATDFNNANSELLARHLLWQQLNDRTPTHVIDVDNQKDNPIHYSTNIYTNMQPQTIDLYNGDANNVGLKQVIDSDIAKVKYKDPTKIPYTGFNEVPQPIQTTLIKQARDITGDKELNNANLYFHKADNGDINLMQITGDKPNLPKDVSLMTVDPLTLNIPANQNVAKVGTGKTKPETINKVINTGQTKKTSGMSDADFQNYLKKKGLVK